MYRLLPCRHELCCTLLLSLICKALNSGIIQWSGDLNFEFKLLYNERNFHLDPEDLHQCPFVHHPEMAMPWLFVARERLCRGDSYEMHNSINNWAIWHRGCWDKLFMDLAVQLFMDIAVIIKCAKTTLWMWTQNLVWLGLVFHSIWKYVMAFCLGITKSVLVWMKKNLLCWLCLGWVHGDLIRHCFELKE